MFSAIAMSGCATTTRSTLLGIGTGAAVGAASGAILDSRDRGQGALYSALTMGVIGGIAGYFTHDALEDRDAQVRQDTLFNLEKFGVSGFSNNPSFLNSPDDGGSKEKVLIITDDPNWTKSNKKQEKGN